MKALRKWSYARLAWSVPSVVAMFTALTSFSPIPSAYPTGVETASLHLSQGAIGIGTGQRVTATVTASVGGEPTSGETATFSSSGDVHFLPVSCTIGSNGECTVVISAGSTSGAQTIQAAVSGLAYNASASQPLLQFGPATSIALGFTNSRLTPNGTSNTSAVASVTDAHGTPVAYQAITFSTNDTAHPVTFGPVGEMPLGTYSTLVTAPQSIGHPNTQYNMIATQSETQTLTASDNAFAIEVSSSLQLGYPTFHTVQYPVGNIGVKTPGLYDDRGRVMLQGAQLYTGYDASITTDLIDHMASATVTHIPGYTWDFNIVRVALIESAWLSSDSAAGCGSAYQQKVDGLVNRITADGMIADLDLHDSDVPHPSSPSCTNPSANQGVPDNGALPFWTSVAQRYGDPTASANYNPMVIFDLYNEPQLAVPNSGDPYAVNGGPDPIAAWMHGGTLAATGQSFVGMESLYLSVRKSAPNTPVIISGVGPTTTAPTDGSNWAFDISPIVRGDLIAHSSVPVSVTTDGEALASDGSNAGTNVIYSTHPYWAGTIQGQDCSPTSSISDGDNSPRATNPNNVGDLDTYIAPVAQRYPVIIGEVGYSCDPPSQGDAAAQYDLTWAQSHGIGWIIWQFRRNWYIQYGTTVAGADYGFVACDGDYCANPSLYQPYQPYGNGQYIYSISRSTTPLLN